jgi:hypothetical protein
MTDLPKTNKLKIGSLDLRQAIRRLPFTLIMVILLILVAWWTNSTFQELTRAWINRLGFAPRDLWFLRWERLVLSAVVTSGGIGFWFALGLVALTSGVAEWNTGTIRTALTFWGAHLVTLILEALVFSVQFTQLGFAQARALFYSRDIGPSAGYMGLLGLITTFLPRPWRWLAFGAMLIYLVAALFLPSGSGASMALEINDDLAHLIAYPLGFASAYIFAIKTKN